MIPETQRQELLNVLVKVEQWARHIFNNLTEHADRSTEDSRQAFKGNIAPFEQTMESCRICIDFLREGSIEQDWQGLSKQLQGIHQFLQDKSLSINLSPNWKHLSDPKKIPQLRESFQEQYLSIKCIINNSQA